MPEHMLPTHAGDSAVYQPTQVESILDGASPVPLNVSRADPEKAATKTDPSAKGVPGAKWKDNEVQHIPKK